MKGDLIVLKLNAGFSRKIGDAIFGMTDKGVRKSMAFGSAGEIIASDTRYEFRPVVKPRFVAYVTFEGR